VKGVTLNPPLKLAWKFDTRGRVLTSAAVVRGVVYASSESGKIVAVDAGRGQKVWELDTGQPVRCSPAVAGKLVYCGSDNGILYALDARTGKPIWQFEAGGPIQASPAVVGDVIVFGANDHNLYALDRRTGRKLWNFRTSRFCVRAPPVIHGDRVFAAGWADWVWCLDLKTGKPHWVHRATGPFWSSPLLAANKVYAGSRRGDFWILAAGKTLQVLDTFRLDSPINATPTAANGVLYVATTNKLYALEVEDR